MIDIQAMRELLNKASKGEWKWTGYLEPENEWRHHGPDLRAGNENIIESWGYDADGLNISDDDAAFIAASHNNMAELLDLAEIGLKARDRK